MSRKPSRFSLTEPCSNCPFRSDRPFYLRAGAAEEIAASLDEGLDFSCHKTLDYGENGGEIVSRTRACAGARATLANEGRISIVETITERIEGSVPQLPPGLPVHPSVAAWVDAMRRNDPSTPGGSDPNAAPGGSPRAR